MAGDCPVHLHRRAIDSVFELLGREERDITASLGWVLSRSENLRAMLLDDLRPGVGQRTIAGISLERFSKTGGYTDIEIRGDTVHCIVEAKRGWNLPTDVQLRKYICRLSDGPEEHMLLVISECSPEYAASQLHPPEALAGVTLLYRSWRQLHALADQAAGHAPPHERRLLAEFRDYLRKVTNMRDQESNLVYVVALAAGKPEWSCISWKDIVNVKRRYFHPYATKKGWPVEPPNYLGFRYDGKLQSIRHVESYEVVTDLQTRIPELRHPDTERYVLYSLGDPIIPQHDVRLGKVFARGGHVWAMIDLLLTCCTISEARDLTKHRRKQST